MAAMMLVGCGGAKTVEKTLTLSAESLLGYTSENVAYDKEVKEAEVDGIKFKYQQIGAYGNGLQFRNKLSDANNGTKSNLYNTVALGKSIKSIAIKLNSGKKVYDNTNALKISFGNTSEISTEYQMFDTKAETLDYTVNPQNEKMTFVKIEIDDAFTYSMYIDSFTITYLG